MESQTPNQINVNNQSSNPGNDQQMIAELLKKVNELEANSNKLKAATRVSLWDRFKAQTLLAFFAIGMFAVLMIGVKYKSSDDTGNAHFEYGVSDTVILSIVGLVFGGGAIVPGLMATKTAQRINENSKENTSEEIQQR